MIINKTKGEWLHRLLTNHHLDIVYQLYLNDFYSYSKYGNMFPLSQATVIYDKYDKYYQEANKIAIKEERKEKLEKICSKSEIV